MNAFSAPLADRPGRDDRQQRIDVRPLSDLLGIGDVCIQRTGIDVSRVVVHATQRASSANRSSLPAARSRAPRAIVDVPSGSHLGEHAVVRFEDGSGRT